MIRCKEVARLMTSDLISGQSLLKRMEIHLHLMMCKHCSRLQKQLKQLASAARRMVGFVDRELDSDAGKEMESRILRKLSHEGQGPPQSR